MDDFTRTTFLDEIRHQCELALGAYGSILTQDESFLFYHLQSFLISSANVSKILFPGGIQGDQSFKEQCRQRAEELRTLLGVEDDSILKNRDLRNHFEHFDERIQKWANRPGPRVFVDRNIAKGMPSQQAISIQGAAPQDFFREYSTPPPTVTFWGDTYPLAPIVAALQDLMAKIPQ